METWIVLSDDGQDPFGVFVSRLAAEKYIEDCKALPYLQRYAYTLYRAYKE